MWKYRTALALSLTLLGAARADEVPTPGQVVALENRARVRQMDAENARRWKGSADMLVLPGLLADRRRQRVEVMAESTGLASNSIVEFILISETSQHGYEALGVSSAKPSDIHKALEFIGMQAGAPYDPRQLRMWPKGERVIVSLVPAGAESNAAPLRIERLILDNRTGTPLPEAGFVFTGSAAALLEDGAESPEYAADTWEPKAVISIYNEPYAVLDIPRLTRKSEVYGQQVVNPQSALDKGMLFSLCFEPEYKDGRKRVRELTLDVGLPPSSASNAMAKTSTPAQVRIDVEAAAFRLADRDGSQLNKEPLPDGVRRALKELEAKGCDPFVAVRFGPDLRLDAVRSACRAIAGLDEEAGMRVEPPGPGQLYFRAFLANEEWRKREKRAGQPWELVLTRKGGTVAGRLTLVETLDESDLFNPQFKTTDFPVPDTQALGRTLAEDAAARKRAGRRPRMPVMLVFADPATSYGELTEFLAPVIGAKYVVYVFLE